MQFNIGKKIGGGGIIGILFLGFIVYASINQEVQLAYFPRYTIAEVTEEYYTGHLIKSIYYEYAVKGEKYKRAATKGKAEMGKRYYVKFSYLNPKHNWLLQDKPVPDSLKNAPLDGWKTIP